MNDRDLLHRLEALPALCEPPPPIGIRKRTRATVTPC